MEKEVKQSSTSVVYESEETKSKVSKTWEAIQRLKGSLIVNDPSFLL